MEAQLQIKNNNNNNNKLTHEQQQDQSTYISCSIFKKSIEEADYSQMYLAQMYS